MEWDSVWNGPKETRKPRWRLSSNGHGRSMMVCCSSLESTASASTWIAIICGFISTTAYWELFFNFQEPSKKCRTLIGKLYASMRRKLFRCRIVVSLLMQHCPSIKLSLDQKLTVAIWHLPCPPGFIQGQSHASTIILQKSVEKLRGAVQRDLPI